MGGDDGRGKTNKRKRKERKEKKHGSRFHFNSDCADGKKRQNEKGDKISEKGMEESLWRVFISIVEFIWIR